MYKYNSFGGNKKNAKGIVKINVENSAGNILLILFK